MNRLVKIPFLGVNDTECKLVEWRVQNGSTVHAGQVVAIVETTKAVVDVEVTAEGLLFRVVDEGTRVPVGGSLGIVSGGEILTDPHAEVLRLEQEEHTALAAAVSSEVSITKKAQALIAKHGLAEDDIRPLAKDGRISEETVQRYLSTRGELDFRRGFLERERVGVVGGVSGGGALITIESVLSSGLQQPVAVFDQDPTFHGKSILGVPIVGDVNELLSWHTSNRLDAVVIAFNRNLSERARVFEDLAKRSVRFTNVIDRTVQLRYGVKVGVGNVILGATYIGACSTIGDNNFISANVHLEHGNQLGSHCGFGPGVFTSGNVTMGSRIRFATGVFVEPSVRIADDCVVASGSIITADVGAGTVVRARYQQSMRNIEQDLS